MTIFRFKTSRQYLRSYILGLPKKGRGEVSRVATSLGVSTTLISQILAGTKTFTPEQCQKLIAYLGLTGLESDYLTFLVMSERAGTEDLRQYWDRKLGQIREESFQLSKRIAADRTLSDEECSIFYSSPLFSAIRLFTSVSVEGKRLDEICARFEISRKKASEMLNFLVRVGLCTEKDGRFLLGSQNTHLAKTSPHLLRHHCNWRVRAIHNSEELSDQELMYTAPVSLSREDFASLREEMVKFIEQFLTKVHRSPAEEIACFNLDFFWIKK